MISLTPEILLNASQVTHGEYGESYEFVLDQDLNVIECVKIASVTQGVICPIKDVAISLDGLLFELNHVRVNPRLDNTSIIQKLTIAFSEIGVKVSNAPESDSIAVCFKPLGEMSDNIRFYLKNRGKLVFLSPAMRPKLLNCIPNKIQSLPSQKL